MLILPIWLWLVIIAIILITAFIRWTKKNLVDRPKSARAVATGTAIASPQLEGDVRSAILNHELTAPGQTQFVAFLQPLEFTRGSDRARTPISLGLSERTLGVSFAKGSLGNRVTVLVSRPDIISGSVDPARDGCYSLRTTRIPRLTLRFQSQDDLNRLDSWVKATQPGAEERMWRPSSPR